MLLLIFSLLGLFRKGSYTYSALNSTTLKQIKNYTSAFTNAHLINKLHTFSIIQYLVKTFPPFSKAHTPL